MKNRLQKSLYIVVIYEEKIQKVICAELECINCNNETKKIILKIYNNFQKYKNISKAIALTCMGEF